MPFQYRPDIDALRGIAVLLVVLFHAFPHFIPGGFIGVDVFFVISGYLITSIILKSEKFSLIHFYDRRIRRLLPSLLAVMLSALLAGWLVLYPAELKQLATHLSKASIFSLNFHLISEHGYFDIESYRKPIMHLWTLSIEEQFYVIWPLIIISCRYLFKNANASYKALWLLVITSFSVNIYASESNTQTVFFHTLTRAWEIGLGAILAFHPNHNKNESPYLAFFGAILIIISAFTFSEKLPYPYFHGLLPTFGALLVIYGKVNLQHYAGLMWLGKISYPLYLWHWVIFSFIYIYLGEHTNIIGAIIAILISLFFAFITERYVERIRFSKNQTTSFGLIFLLLAIASSSLFITNNNGLPDRNHITYTIAAEEQLTRTPITNDECIERVSKLTNKPSILFDYCRSTLEKTNIRIAIIGDSHAHTLFPGVSREAQKHDIGTVTYANSSCPPLIGFEWHNDKVSKKQCQDKINNIINAIKRDTTIFSVVISTRGPVYFLGEVEKPYTKENITSTLNNATTNKKLTLESFTRGLDETLKELIKITHIKKISILLENPELDFDPRDSIPRPFDHFKISNKFSGIEQHLYQLRMKDTFTETERIAKKYNIEVLHSSKWLCKNNYCPSIIKGSLAYADDDHLSIHGSNIVGKGIIKNIIHLATNID